MADVMLRAVLPNEYGRVKELADEIWHVCYKDILSAEQIKYMLDMMYSSNVIAKESSEGVRYRFVTADCKNAGFLAWGPCETDSTAAKLHKLYLCTENQGTGVGGSSIELVKKEAKSAGFSRLILNVNRQNQNAIKCYLKNGFKIIREEDNDIGSGYYMNDFVMQADI